CCKRQSGGVSRELTNDFARPGLKEPRGQRRNRLNLTMKIRHMALNCIFRTIRFSTAAAIIGSAIILSMAGCASTPSAADFQSVATQAANEPVVLREGDVIRLTFPGAPANNTVAAIRRDGIINLDL